MATLNERLRDFSVARQIDLLSLSQDEAERLVAILASSDEVLETLLRRALQTVPTRRRLQTIRERVRAALAATHATIRGDLNEFISELGRDSANTEVVLFERSLAGVVDVTTPRLAAVVAAIRATPMDGAPLATWLRQYERNDFDRVWRAVLRGVTIGQTSEQIVRAVIGSAGLRFADGQREVSRRGLRALVRTAITHAATVGREQVWEENRDLMRGVQWVATLDGRTTLICASLDGDIFPIGEGPRPPIHMQCRSVVAPVLKGWRALGLRGLDGETRASMDGQIPAVINYEEWLKTRSRAFQEQVLGKARARLFREGGLSLDRFVSDRGARLTLEQLRARVPGAFAEVGL